MTRDPRTEAAQLSGFDRADVRVLEPAPPAVTTEPWFADDPLEPGGRLSPLGQGWETWVQSHPEQRGWAAERWLVGRSLPRPPAAETLAPTRLALHRLAVYVISPARRRVNGKLALRWTLGGFGTPYFGDNRQVRVTGGQLVCERPGGTDVHPVGTLAEAAGLVLDGPPDLEWAAGFDVPGAGDLDAPLGVDAVAAGWIGEWFGFGTRVLEAVRAGHDTRVQLWPEHFDLAVSIPVGGASATFGVSPGDAGHQEPYLYVLPGRAVEPGGVWNAVGYSGAVLPAAALVETPIESALAFFAVCTASLENR